MPKGRVETPITDQEIAFAHLVMAGTMTDRDAAKAVGISSSQAAYVKAKPRVKAYMDQHRATVAAAIAEHESESPVELNINRKTIMARYWELSQLPCSDTNGSIAGQVRALDSLREMLGLMGPPAGKPEGDQPPAPNVYRAKWMREAEGETEEDDMDVEPEVEVPPTPQPKAESRPAVVHTPQTVTPAGINRPRVVEPAEPYEEPPGANFGRFQGLH